MVVPNYRPSILNFELLPTSFRHYLLNCVHYFSVRVHAINKTTSVVTGWLSAWALHRVTLLASGQSSTHHVVKTCMRRIRETKA